MDCTEWGEQEYTICVTKGTVLSEKRELDMFGNEQARGDVGHTCAQLPKPTAIYEAVVIQNPTSLSTYILDNYWRRPRITPSLPT